MILLDESMNNKFFRKHGLLDKEKFYAYEAVFVSFLFMICIFAPIDVYYANMDEYWFSFTQMFSLIALIFLVAVGVASAVSIILCRSRISDLFFIICIGVYAFFYIQGNYIPRKYGVLNGVEINWGEYPQYAVASILLAVCCIVVCIFLFVKFRNKIYNIGKYFAAFLFLIQMVTVVTLFVQHGVTTTQSMTIATQKNMTEFSKDHNLIVIVLDTYDGRDFEYLLDKDSARQEKVFENFIYYKNTLGAYPTTKCALPQILSGNCYYNEQPYQDYIVKAYEDNELFDVLERNKYELDIYTMPGFLGSNIQYSNKSEGRYYINDIVGFANSMYRMVAFNYAPHQLKKYFFIDSNAFNDKYDVLLSEQLIEDERKVYDLSIIGFNKMMKEKGISTDRRGNLFKFYHFDGIHAPYTFGRNIIEDGREYCSYDEAEGNVEILNNLFEQLKERGIYDSSTIVIMADHGHFEKNQNPIFFIKNQNEKHPFKVSDIPVSYMSLLSIWQSLANGEGVDEEYLEDIDYEDGRKFLYYDWDDAWQREFMPGMEEFRCNGKAYDMNSLVGTGMGYYPSKENHSYHLGDLLEFSEGRSGYSYCQYGVHSGVVNTNALLQFDIKEKYDNLAVTIETSDYCGYGGIAIYVNDYLVSESSYSPEKTIKFVIPQEYVRDGKINLKLLADPRESSEARLKVSNLIIDNLCIDKTDEECSVSSQCTSFDYVFDEELDYSNSTRSGMQHVLYGVGNPEDWGAWSDGNESLFRFKIDDVSRDLEIKMKYLTFDGRQRSVVYVNKKKLMELDFSESDEQTILIPSEYFDNQNYLDLKIEYLDAHSPKSIDSQSGDNRIIAIGIKNIVISQCR